MNREKAKCRDTCPSKFFPKGTRAGRTSTGLSVDEAEEEAAKFCIGCPIQSDCLEFALENGETQGVWGGTSSEQRRVIARTRRHRIKVA